MKCGLIFSIVMFWAADANTPKTLDDFKNDNLLPQENKDMQYELRQILPPEPVKVPKNWRTLPQREVRVSPGGTKTWVEENKNLSPFGVPLRIANNLISKAAIYHKYRQYKSAATNMQQFYTMTNAFLVSNLKTGGDPELLLEVTGSYIDLYLRTGGKCSRYTVLMPEVKEGSVLDACLRHREVKIKECFTDFKGNDTTKKKAQKIYENAKAMQEQFALALAEIKIGRKPEIQLITEQVVDAWLNDLELKVPFSPHSWPRLGASPFSHNIKSHKILRWSFDLDKMMFICLVDIEFAKMGNLKEELSRRWIIYVKDNKVFSFIEFIDEETNKKLFRGFEEVYVELYMFIQKDIPNITENTEIEVGDMLYNIIVSRIY